MGTNEGQQHKPFLMFVVFSLVQCIKNYVECFVNRVCNSLPLINSLDFRNYKV